MEDAKIIKALECCLSNENGKCEECPLERYHNEVFTCMRLKQEYVLDLINRLKAELDESREKNAGLALALLHEVVNEDEQLRNEITKVAKSEAYKEFAESLKETIEDYQFVIDNLLKEMG